MQKQNNTETSETCSVWSSVESARLVVARRVNSSSTGISSSAEHQLWGFVYFLGGSACVASSDRTHRHKRSHMAIYPPGMCQSQVGLATNPEETVVLAVDVAGRIPSDANLLLPDPNGELRWLCQQILAEAQDEGITSLAQTYTQALLHLVERLWTTHANPDDSFVDKVIQHMQNNLSGRMDLRTLAGVACVSETHLVHQFTSRVGISPMRYLQRLRIEKAMTLLSTTSIPAYQIAAQVGFEDPFYFSRAFKRASGYSPRAFRAGKLCNPVHILSNPVYSSLRLPGV